MRRVEILRRALAAASCAAAMTASAQAQSADDSQIQDLTWCAGAVAAYANLAVVDYPQGARGPWAELLGRILDRLWVEPGVEGMSGRYAASAARSDWLERPRAEQEAAANQCRERFGGS